MQYTVDFNRYGDSDAFGNILPSVYVDRVEISQGSAEEKTKFSGCLIIYEMSSDELESLWYTNDTLRGLMTIEVKLEYAISGIIDVKTEVLSLNVDDLNTYKFRIFTDKTVYKIPYEFSFEVSGTPADISFAKIEARVLFDESQIEGTYGFSYPSDLPTEGLVNIKTIIKNSRIVDTQKAYFTPQNKIWLGSRHMHEIQGPILQITVPMAGTKHTPIAHPILETQEIPNYVILASVKEKIEISLDMSLQSTVEELFGISQETNRSSYSTLIRTGPAIFSNQYLTRVPENKMVSYFSVDFEDLFLRNSRYGTIYSYLSANLRESLIASAEIKEIYVYRLRKDIENVVPILIEDPTQIELSDSGLVRTYKITDSDIIYGSLGEYCYQIQLRIEEPMFSYLQRFFSRLGELISDLKVYLIQTDVPNKYDHTYDTFRKKYYNILTSTNYTGTKYWDEAQDLFNMIFQTFNFDVEAADLREMLRSIHSYLDPRTATLSTMRLAIEIFENIENNFQSLISLENFQNYFDSKNSSYPKSSTTAPANSIEIIYDFEKFNISDYQSYLEFIEIDESNEIGNRAQYIIKYAGNVGRYVTDLSTALPIDGQYSFFAISSLRIGDSIFSTKDWEAGTYQELSAMHNTGQKRSLEGGLTKVEASEMLLRSGITISFDPGEYITVGMLTDDVYTNLSIFLPINDSEITYSAPETFSSNMDLANSNSQQSYSLLQEIITGTSTTSPTSDSLAFGAIGNNLNSQLNKFLIYLKYIMMGRIEYLSDASYSGEGGVKNPTWEAFDSSVALDTSRDILCRVRRVESAGYSGLPSNFFDYNILNEYFILKG